MSLTRNWTKNAHRVLFAGMMFVLALASTRLAHAQDVRTITFDEALEIALDQNTELLRAENTLEQREIDVARQRMDFFPNLTLSAGGSRQYGRGFSQEAGEIVNETSDFFRANVSSSINLFNGFRKLSSLDQAQLQAAAGTQRLERTRADVVFQVAQGYINLIENQAQIRIRKEQLTYQRELLEQIEEQVDVGTVPKSDLYQQQAAVAEAELALLEAQQAYQVSKTELIGTLQLEPFGQYEFVAPSLETVEPAPADYDLERLLERAYEERADLDAQRLAVQAAREGVDVAQSGYYPRLELSVGYGSNWSSLAQLPIPGTGSLPDYITSIPGVDRPVHIVVPGTGAPVESYQPSFFDQLDNRRGGSISLSLSIPLFDRLETHHAVEEAQVRFQTARYDLQDLRQQIALDVRQAYLDYQQAQKALAVSEERLEAAERAREAAQARYNLGAATYVELAQANADYVNAASQHARARYTLLFRQKLIDYYLGVLDPSGVLFE